MTTPLPHRRDLLGLAAGAATGALAAPTLGWTAPAAHFDWTLHPPESVGMSKAGLEAVRATVQKHLDNHDQLGAVTIIARRNKLVWYKAQGVRDPATGEPLRRDDLFRMMSSSKPITATAILMMLEAGRLSLDDKVSRFIPTFKDQKVIEPPPGWEQVLKDPTLRPALAAKAKLVPAARDITIRDLITHRSGLESVGGTLGPGPSLLVNDVGFMSAPPTDATLAAFVPKLGAQVLDFQPGARWSYSPLFGFDTLLRIVEIASGQPADVFLRERIFEPLGMRDTYFNVPPDKQSRVLKLYERKDNAWKPAAPMFGNGPTRYFSGAGGLLSTAHDYIQFEAMLANRGELNGRRILKPETVTMMSTNQVGTQLTEWLPFLYQGQGFGLGVGITVDPAAAKWGRGLGSFGWGGAYGTESWVDPEHELAVAFFVQQPVRSALVDFQKAVTGAIVA